MVCRVTGGVLFGRLSLKKGKYHFANYLRPTLSPLSKGGLGFYSWTSQIRRSCLFPRLFLVPFLICPQKKDQLNRLHSSLAISAKIKLSDSCQSKSQRTSKLICCWATNSYLTIRSQYMGRPIIFAYFVTLE